MKKLFPPCPDTKIAIVVASFNETVTEELFKKAVQTLEEKGVSNITALKVPGACELPYAAKELQKTGQFDAIICLGAVIKGQTAHFDYVSSGVTQGILSNNLTSDIPVIFGVLTCETLDLALERSGPKNKGKEFALAALDMIHLRCCCKKIQELESPLPYC